MNTRGRSSSASGANPTLEAPPKRPAPRPRTKAAETNAAPPSSKPGGKKRKQKEMAEDSTLSTEALAEFKAWKAAQAAEKLKSDSARQKAAKAAKNQGMLLNPHLFPSSHFF